MEDAFDRVALESRLGGDAELIADVVRLFIEDCPARLDAIGTAIAGGDRSGLQSAAHALKGAAGYMEAPHVVASAAALESAARDGRLTAAPELFATLTRNTDTLVSQLRATLER